MSRHSRHRSSDQRRFAPTGRTDLAQPLRPSAPEVTAAAPSTAAPVPAAPRDIAPRDIAPDLPSAATPVPSVVAEPGQVADFAAPIAMASLHLPTAAASFVEGPGLAVAAGCTPAQLRRFIKSRAYLPVHEIRRRFGMETADDDVTGFEIESGRVFVGLPQREGRILGDLVRAGEVGYELQLDPEAPIIIGVYPMRPVTRQ